MPAPPEAGSFLGGLPPGFVREVRLPLPYLHMREVETAGGPPTARMAASAHHRTSGYVCRGFPRPISRCFGGEE